MAIGELILVILIYGAIFYFIAELPIPDPFPRVARMLVLLLFVVHVLARSGLLNSLNIKL